MKDIRWDTKVNDIVIADGDFAMTDRCSNQNGALILIKRAVNITKAHIGVALDELYPNLAPGDFDLLLTEGIGQIYEDGAQYVDEKTIRSGWQNIFSTDGSVIYNE